jgi:hypothetical protein
VQSLSRGRPNRRGFVRSGYLAAARRRLLRSVKRHPATGEPHRAVRLEVGWLLQTLKAADEQSSQPAGERRRELLDQLQRLQDLYVLGDLTKAQYVMRRQALEEEVQRLGPPTDPASERAKELLEDFPRFWEIETDPAERRKLLLSLFAQVWAEDGRIVAVQPHDPFLPYFRAAQQSQEADRQEGWCRKRERRGSNPRSAPHQDPHAG